MKLSCDVIKDMLPLYYDEVCSEDTRKLVEEHLKECESCRDMKNKMGLKVSFLHQDLEETTFFKNIQQQLKKRDTILAVIAIILIFLVGIGAHLARTYKFIPVGANSFEITEIAHLSDGAIGLHLSVSDGKDVSMMTSKKVDENGVVYIHGKRSLSETWMKTSDPFGYHDEYFYYNAAHQNEWLSGLVQTANGDLPYIMEVRFGTEDDYVLIWKEDMELPEASEEMETDYGQHKRW